MKLVVGLRFIRGDVEHHLMNIQPGRHVRRKRNRLLLVTLGFFLGACSDNVVAQTTARGDGKGGSQAAQLLVDGRRAYRHLNDICNLGPRFSGSDGMRRQQRMLAEHFRRLGGTVWIQPFQVRHPETGRPVKMGNLVVQWHADRTSRILLSAHYDTRPFPDRDSDISRRHGTFIGANDGASGVAVLCELAYHMASLQGSVGVDFVLFDGEEFVFDDQRDSYFCGSTYFARQHAAHSPKYRYRWCVLLDMVGDAELQIYQERISVYHALPLVQAIWRVAKREGADAFVPRIRHRVQDDHLPLNEIAHIPTCLLIDFDYPRPGTHISYWHTRQDTPDKCSAASLAVVGRVLLAWLREER